MEHLPKKTCQNGISYTLVGDYYIWNRSRPMAGVSIWKSRIIS